MFQARAYLVGEPRPLSPHERKLLEAATTEHTEPGQTAAASDGMQERAAAS